MGFDVAPFAGAWIETWSACRYRSQRVVAPFAGAWIETVIVVTPVRTPVSLPSRERGSKPSRRSEPASRHRRSLRGSVDRNRGEASGGPSAGRVAPFAGAWIETSISAWSFLSWRVAPFAGAWIETCHERLFLQAGESLPSRERGSKPFPRPALLRASGRSLRGSVDRNITRGAWILHRRGRSLRGSVDRNHQVGGQSAGVGRSLPSRERGSKQRAVRVIADACLSPPSRGRGSKLPLDRFQA